MTIVRYLDVLLVLATAPFVIAAGLPVFGYLVAAVVWLLTRVAAETLHPWAMRLGDPRARAGLVVAVMMGRVWAVALAVLLARYAGSKDDGVMAAVLVLAAFTVYFVLNLLTRGGQLQGRPSPS